MAQRKIYAPRLDKDPVGRKQIAVMRLAGFSCQQIADLTGRHRRTIDEEITRPEHKKIMRSCVNSVGKKKLPRDVWEVVEQALNERSDF